LYVVLYMHQLIWLLETIVC